MAEDFQKLIEEQRKTNKLLEQQAISNAKGDDLKTSVKNSAGEIINDILIGAKAVKESDETQEKLDDIQKNDGKNYKSAFSQRDTMIEKLDGIGGNELSPTQLEEKEKDRIKQEEDARNKRFNELGKSIIGIFKKFNPLPKGTGGFLKNLLKLGLGGIGIIMLTNFLKSKEWKDMKENLIPNMITILKFFGKVGNSVSFRLNKLIKDLNNDEKSTLEAIGENKGTIFGAIGLFFSATIAKMSADLTGKVLKKGLSHILKLGAIALPLLFTPIGLFAAALVGAYFVKDTAISKAKEIIESEGAMDDVYAKARIYSSTFLGEMGNGVNSFLAGIMSIFNKKRADEMKKRDYSVLINNTLRQAANNVANFFTQDIPEIFNRMVNSVKRFFMGSTQEDVEGDIAFRQKLVEKRQKKIAEAEKKGAAEGIAPMNNIYLIRQKMLRDHDIDMQRKLQMKLGEMQEKGILRTSGALPFTERDGSVEDVSDQSKIGAGAYRGGKLPKGQISMVGELGPEFVVSKSDAQVFSARKSEKLIMSALNGAISGNVENLPRNVGGNMSSLNTGNAGGNGGASIVNTPVSVVNNSSVNNTQNRLINIVDADPFLARLNTVAI